MSTVRQFDRDETRSGAGLGITPVIDGDFSIAERDLAAKAIARSEISTDNYVLRSPEVDDGADLHKLVEETGVLDVNSPYSYLMLGEYFSETCVLAERRGRTVGFLSGLLPPEQDDTVFVWQVAVSKTERKRGLGLKLLKELVSRPVCRTVRYLETTITPSNSASMRLFRKFAHEVGASCNVETVFDKRHFPDGAAHEPERRFRIGPFKGASV